MNKKRGMLLLAGMCAASVILPQATAMAAMYESNDTDGGANLVDYLENRRRARRENRLTEDQQKLQKDVAEMKGDLSHPVDPSKPMPVSVEGEDMFYDQATGDVYAKGDVRITEIDGRRFESEEANGNLKKKEIESPGEGHIIQVPPADMKADLTGYHIVYNYGKRTGSLENAKGKIDKRYVSGKKIELFPERVLIYDGFVTRCGAELPDYRYGGDLIEIYPEKEMIIHKAKYWIKDKVVYTRDRMIIDLADPDQAPMLPRVGYNSTDGVWISDTFSYSILPRTQLYTELAYYSKHGMKNVYGAKWANGGNYVTVQYGEFEDSNEKWIKKKPTVKYEYKNRVGDLPLSYTLTFEKGKWEQNNRKSIHTYYNAALNRDPLYLFGGRKWHLNLGVSYGVTTESYDHSKVKGFSYNGVLYGDMDDNWTVYAGYYFSKANTENSLFDYNLDSYSKKGVAGISWQFTDRDRILVANEFDMGKHHLKDTDYYWFHDMHCAQMIFEYRAKRRDWHVTVQFTPW